MSASDFAPLRVLLALLLAQSTQSTMTMGGPVVPKNVCWKAVPATAGTYHRVCIPAAKLDSVGWSVPLFYIDADKNYHYHLAIGQKVQMYLHTTRAGVTYVSHVK